jgi:dTDP-4-dehydrorhamnose reductase
VKVLVTGAGGMLGRAVCRNLAAGHQVIAATRRELDVTDHVALQDRLDQARPDWVVHLAALTDVDRCEREPAAAFAVNSAPLSGLAAWCGNHGAGLVLLSSIAVFDGTKASAYGESDTPCPANVYGRSKWEAERLAMAAPRHLVVRTGWLFAGDESDHKFVGRILKLARERSSIDVVRDKWGSPTWVHDLAAGLRRLMEEDQRGLVHCVNEGAPASRVDVARAVVEEAGLRTEVNPVSSDRFSDLAPRPAMEAARSVRTAGWLQPWSTALRTCLKLQGS